ncbi:MAG: hypothetical protein ABIL02_06600 [candidate division WOR-3 bacterium]
MTNFDYRAYWGNVEIELRIIPEKQISVYYQGRFVQKFHCNGKQ